MEPPDEEAPEGLPGQERVRGEVAGRPVHQILPIWSVPRAHHGRDVRARGTPAHGRAPRVLVRGAGLGGAAGAC
eukprot:4083610-Alexandrium_andersonii.AAC.1